MNEFIFTSGSRLRVIPESPTQSFRSQILYIVPDRGSFWSKLMFYRGNWDRTMRWFRNGSRYRRMMKRRK